MENEIVTREYKDVVYDTLSEAQKFYLYLPEDGEGPFPLVFFIYEGGWFSGDKTDGQESAWVTLRDKGYAVASINYRLSGETPHSAGIQHGNADTICPISQSERLYQAIIEKAGEEKVEFDILEGAEHGDSDFETAENMERIVEFLRRWGL